jgi:prepilin-type N-terminal cleavage/methylation domain-containing protein
MNCSSRQAIRRRLRNGEGGVSFDGRRRGFTLVELVWVMLIAGIITSLAVPTLSTLPESRAGAAAARVMNDLTYARQRAVATGTVTWIDFDPGAETWALLADDPASPGFADAQPIVDPADGGPMVGTLGADPFTGVEIVRARFNGQSVVGFDWLGRPLRSNGNPLTATGEVEITGPHLFEVDEVTGHVVHTRPP